MNSQGIIALLIIIGLSLVCGAVYLLSHKPRDALASELFYKTNDNLGKSYDLLSDQSPNVPEKERQKIEISVVVPCYNETRRLGKMLDECVDHLEREYHSKYEIIIVDDGSLDGSDEYAIKKASELSLEPHTLKVIKLEKNRGKGGAVTHGLLHSRGRFCLFADADGATKFSDIDKLLEYMRTIPEDVPVVAVGSRAHMVDTDAVVRRSFIRNFLMYGLHTLVYVFGIRNVKDTQCGFKMFNRLSVRKIFPHMHTERWIFDVEVLMLGEMQNIPIKEIAVNWQEIDGSKIDIARDSIEMAIDLVVTRLAYILGIYKLDDHRWRSLESKKKDQ